MRFVVSSNRIRGLNQVAVIGILAVSAGCSTDFSRFDAEQYSASIVENKVSAEQSNPYPEGVDPVTTASISRSSVMRPPQPGGYINGSTQSQIAQTQIAQNQYRPIASSANAPVAQLQPATNYNTYNTYNTYQTSAAKITPTPQAPRIVNKPVSVPRYVDPITTSSLKPARPANVKPVILSNARAQKPLAVSTSGTPSGWTGIGGTAVSVREGETLYNISKRYGVPVKELIKANNISNANQVVAGQRIIVPTYVYSASAPVSAPDNNPKTRAARASRGMMGEVSSGNIIVPTKSPNGYKPGLAPMSVARRNNTTLTGNASSYSVASGDTLGSIAGKQNIRLSDLMKANGLTGSNIRVGQKLIIPGRSAYQGTQKTVGLAPMGVDKTVTGSTPKPYVKPGNPDAIRISKVDEKAPARTGIATFRWPATGKIISKFGERRRGQRNDGIDILVPEGTSVKAAENGVVIYSDSELQEFGNLVLIRHAGGWVSAYAHNKSLNVKRGEKVSRGQIIAKSGYTGNAERPMIHFELRKDANPVNPEKYLR